MALLTTEQYGVLKILAQRLEVRSDNGRTIDVEKFLRAIDREVARGAMSPVFTKTPKEAWDRYRRDVIHAFFLRWEQERFETERRRIIGVRSGRVRADFYEVVNGDPSEEARLAASMYYQQGVTLVGRYAKYTGKSVDEVVAEVREAMELAAPVLVNA